MVCCCLCMHLCSSLCACVTVSALLSPRHRHPLPEPGTVFLLHRGTHRVRTGQGVHHRRRAEGSGVRQAHGKDVVLGCRALSSSRRPAYVDTRDCRATCYPGAPRCCLTQLGWFKPACTGACVVLFVLVACAVCGVWRVACMACVVCAGVCGSRDRGGGQG